MQGLALLDPEIADFSTLIRYEKLLSLREIEAVRAAATKPAILLATWVFEGFWDYLRMGSIAGKLDLGCWILNLGFWILGTEMRRRWNKDSRQRGHRRVPRVCI